jgi:serine protease Do
MVGRRRIGSTNICRWANFAIGFALLLLVQPGGLSGAESAAVSADASASERLQKLFAGGTPMGLADLKAMQSHVQKLTEQLSKATVGVEVGQAQGSGVIISKDGMVLTAAHVAGKPNVPVSFFLADGRTVKGITLGLNRSMDAGLMKITDAGEYPFAEMGASNDLREGQWCLATGHPGGYQSDRGIVLRLGRVLLLAKEAITTDCTLVGGDSGGPLFDMQGRVIGINSRIAGPIEANMHVPVSTYKDQDTWERLNKGDAWGHYPGQEPYIGVRGEPGTTNAKVASVVPDSPAAKAGLKAGDIVLKFGDLALSDFPSLSAAVRQRQPGDDITLSVQRADATIELKLKLGKKGG